MPLAWNDLINALIEAILGEMFGATAVITRLCLAWRYRGYG